MSTASGFAEAQIVTFYFVLSIHVSYTLGFLREFQIHFRVVLYFVFFFFTLCCWKKSLIIIENGTSDILRAPATVMNSLHESWTDHVILAKRDCLIIITMFAREW